MSIYVGSEGERAAGAIGIAGAAKLPNAISRLPLADRNERLCVLVRHEMNTNGRPANAALLSELNAAIKA